jgi:hypothetical protein
MKNMAHIVDGVVVNISLWDGESEWLAPQEVVEIPESESVAIGWSYVKKKFVNPNQGESE